MERIYLQNEVKILCIAHKTRKKTGIPENKVNHLKMIYLYIKCFDRLHSILTE